MLALGDDGGRVMLVDEATGEVRWAVQAHSGGNLRCVAMSPGNGRFVASVGVDHEHWMLLDSSSGDLHRVGATHDGTGACICEFPNLSHRLLQEGCPMVAHTKGLLALAFSPCGHRLATGGLDGAVIVWDAQTGEAERRMLGYSKELFTLSFSADGARLASGSLDCYIRVWDATTGALLRSIKEPQRYFLHVQFSRADNRRLASVGGGGKREIHLWDVETGEKIRSIRGRVFTVFSPDGRTIATADASKSSEINLMDAETGTRRSTLSGQSTTGAASFSVDDGSRIATGSWDGTCKVWDSSTGALLRTIELGVPVLSVSFGRDWVRDTQRGVAFAMGQHPRLGAGSQVLVLQVGVVRMILDRV